MNKCDTNDLIIKLIDIILFISCFYVDNNIIRMFKAIRYV